MNIETILRTPQQKRSPDLITEVCEFLARQKAASVARGDEKEANAIFIREGIFKIQNDYWDCFDLIGKGQCYLCWCKLEQIEIAVKFILNHHWPVEDEYSIKFIREYTEKFQKLFPYKLFASSEIVKIDKYCSICDTKVSLRNSCSHIKGQIYMGESCHHRVTKAEVVGISLVKDPFNKYAVAGIAPKDDGSMEDPYNYKSLEYLYSLLDSPFDRWRSEEYKIFEPHSKYRETRNDKCPCGSGQKYKTCCLKKEGVELDHTQLYLENPTKKSLEVFPTYIQGNRKRIRTKG